METYLPKFIVVVIVVVVVLVVVVVEVVVVVVVVVVVAAAAAAAAVVVVVVVVVVVGGGGGGGGGAVVVAHNHSRTSFSACNFYAPFICNFSYNVFVTFLPALFNETQHNETTISTIHILYLSYGDKKCKAKLPNQFGRGKVLIKEIHKITSAYRMCSLCASSVVVCRRLSSGKARLPGAVGQAIAKFCAKAADQDFSRLCFSFFIFVCLLVCLFLLISAIGFVEIGNSKHSKRYTCNSFHPISDNF